MSEEAFLEHPWHDDHTTAQQQRDSRLQHLQEQGFLCTALDLWNVQGQRVYLLISSENIDVRDEEDARSRGSRRERSQAQAGHPRSRSLKETSKRSARPVRRLPNAEVR